MIKNLTGGAIINYGPTLPDTSAAYDGALFYKTSGSDKGMFIFGFNQDISPNTFGDQVAQVWNQVQSTAFVLKTGDEMTGPLQITGTSTVSAFGAGEQAITFLNTANTPNARSGAIRWMYDNSTNVSAQIDMIVGSSNNRGVLAFSTRGSSGAIAERVRIDETGIKLASGATFWNSENDGAGSGLDADTLDGQDSSYFLNASNLSSGTLNINRLPFTPVQQGGGTGMQTDKVYIGWLGSSQLGLQVNSTNFGATWPISISGNATTANSANTANTANSATTADSARFLKQNGSSGGTNMTFNWQGQPGQPTWVWGGTDGIQMYVYNPANFSVSFATTAGSVSWTNVTSRPTTVSAFANDAGYVTGAALGNYYNRNNDVWQASADGFNRFFYASNGRSFYSSGDGHEFRTQNGGTLFYVDVNGNTTAAGNVTAYSDARLKTDVKRIENALDIVKALEGVDFTQIANGKRGSGLIAQNVLAHKPELVVQDEDGYLSVAYGNLVGTLVEAIKTLSDEIDELKAKLKD